MAVSWDPTAYLAFDDHRSRPFHDLLARIGAEAPRRVVDLGCGPGHLTEVLGARWPDAEIDALDSSPEMVADARRRGIRAREADVRDWHPGEHDDVVVTNAVLQWVPGHRELLGRWLREMPSGGWFGMQVPGNHSSPSHELLRWLLATSRWKGRVELRAENMVGALDAYADTLVDAGAGADIWETTYLHRLSGPDPVLTWMAGTALRPVRDVLADAEWDEFRAELAPMLREAYPAGADGHTWFPFRRLFAVARIP
jgi:trans-aconitate 2-methyltransferase